MFNKIATYSFDYHDEEYFYMYKHLKVSIGSLAILKDSTIKFTPPKDFNDPFDCVWGVTDDHFHTASELKALAFKKLSPTKRMEDARRAKHLQIKQMDSGEYFENFHYKLGVCCLNHNPLNILMWSHYADNHKGFLIEFKFLKKSIKPSFRGAPFFPLPVIYTEKMPLISKKDQQEQSTSVILEKAYLNKSIDWAYEKEFRIIRTNISDSIQKYPQNETLSSIVLGWKISDEDELRIKNILAELNIEIPLYKAERIHNNYGLTISNHPRLDVFVKKEKKK